MAHIILTSYFINHSLNNYIVFFNIANFTLPDTGLYIVALCKCLPFTICILKFDFDIQDSKQKKVLVSKSYEGSY